MSDLLPCPFCGCDPSIEMTGFHLGARKIYCDSYDCMGPHTTAANLEDATAQWNKRAPTWQPIDTVPKDGTAVWVSNGFSMRVAFWANGKEFEHQGSVGGGWRDFFEACHPNRMSDLMFAPAYWKALPTAPQRELALTAGNTTTEGGG